MQFRRLIRAVLLLAFIGTLPACNRGPGRVKQPTIDASAAGKLAMEMYDKNGDGKVAGPELDAAPGLKAALKNLDTDGDGAVSADEVTARVNVWKAMQAGMMSVPLRVTLDGQPLGDAKIVFEPEAFLGDDIKLSVGVTSANGDARPAVRPE